MAVKTAEMFLQRLEKESSLRTQLNTVRPRNTAELLRFAQGKGFVFSEEDLQAALKNKPSKLIKA